MSIAHMDVAAYSLGLLEAKDREDFEAHLAGCLSCQAELGEFSAMADLFAGLGPVLAQAEEPDDSAVADLVARRASAQRKRTRRSALFAAAAGLALLAGGVAAGLGLAPTKAQPVVLSVVGTRHSATNLTTGLRGVVGLAAKPWGTQVTLKLSKVRGPLDCQLIAVSDTGLRRILVGWRVPPAGYGVPSHPAPLLIVGGTSIPKQDLSAIEIQVVHGPTLLTISI
ncbi:MAG TPA: hypothetical protein VN695_13290 [Streptosporangiaceae bacterium]|nr:hypothetical protein [Streptosporangiaceae bacterium]